VSGGPTSDPRAAEPPYDPVAARRHTRRVALGVFAVEILSIVALWALNAVFGS
jgi:hypothetical protein